MRPFKTTVLFAILSLSAGCATLQYRLGTTGAGQALSRVTSDKMDEFGPAISPDGRMLLFDTRFSSDKSVVGVDPASGMRRTVFTSTNSESEEASWDPQGRFFVYSTNSPGSWSIVRTLTNSANAAVSIVVSGELAPVASDPAVSPDGARIAFATFIRTQWQLAVVNVDGSQFTLLGEGRNPAWSPDGRLIAFTRLVNGWSQLFTLNPATGTEVSQITSGEFHSLTPTWSPDGRLILYSSSRGGRSSRSDYDLKTNAVLGVMNLYVVRPDGTNVVQLTNGDGLAVTPAWGKDGWIYFASNQAGNFDIWKLRPDASILAQ